MPPNSNNTFSLSFPTISSQNDLNAYEVSTTHVTSLDMLVSPKSSGRDALEAASPDPPPVEPVAGRITSNDHLHSSHTIDIPSTNESSFRFEHAQDEHGNHVVIGREGKLQRCEDEVKV